MSGKWTGGVVEWSDDDSPTVDEWQPVPVPGRNAAFDDDAEEIAYRTTFGDPRSGDDERALLELRGTYARADVWLNGTQVGTQEPYFVPFRTTFDPRPENELVVFCERPDSPIGIYASEDLPADLETPAIRWDVDVESRPRTFLRRLEARPRFTEDGGAIDVEIEVDAGEPVDDAITLSVRPEGFRGGATMQLRSVEVDAGERVTVTETLDVREPSLWWPREYGPQHRYTVRAKLGDDVVTRTVGFRHVERDDEGLSINGRRVRVRGFTRLPGGDPVADVDRAVDANATLLRPRAHVPQTELYEACDEAGVLVWQDLPTSGPPAGLSAERSRDLAGRLEETYGHHPSLAMYGVSEETGSPFDGLYGSGFLTKLRFRYRAWQADVDRSKPAAVAEDVPGNRPVVSSIGPPGTDPDAAALAPGWQYLAADDVEWLLERHPDLATVVGSVETGSLAGDVDPESIPGLDATVLEARLGDDPDVEESQAYQARVLKTVVEALRRRGSGVLMAGTLRDLAPGGGSGVLARDGDEKAAFRALARSFEPVQAVLDGPPAPGSVGITLCNDVRAEFEATVGWEAGDADGSTEVDVGPLETVDAGSADIPRDASRVELTVTVDGQTVSNRYYL